MINISAVNLLQLFSTMCQIKIHKLTLNTKLLSESCLINKGSKLKFINNNYEKQYSYRTRKLPGDGEIPENCNKNGA